MPDGELLDRRPAGPRELHWIKENIPCQWACPALTDIPAYIRAITDKKHDVSYDINRHSNVLPGVLGRVCSRPCEDHCRHGESDLGTPVAICWLKRVAADSRKKRIKPAPLFQSTGKRVAVIGSGPAGLAAGHDLALLGHDVTIFEGERVAGGMLHLGIPEFRLPRDVLGQEIGAIEELGVEIVLRTKIGKDRSVEELLDTFDATVIAAGNMVANDLDVPGSDLEGVQLGLPFLMNVNLGRKVDVGKNVVIIGGGYTALDCVRTAKRLGGGESGLYYRRTERYLAGTTEEIHELKFERIGLNMLSKPTEIHGKNGKVSAVTFVRTTPLSETGKFRDIEGSQYTVEADSVILAIGQHADFSFIPESLGLGEDKWGLPVVRADSCATGREGLFIAGDCITGPGDVIGAVAHGRKVAVSVDRYLMGRSRHRKEMITVSASTTGREREYDFIERQKMPTIGSKARRSYTTEVEKGFPAGTALAESRRCYLCHYKYEIDIERCIYCMACIEVAPRDCIKKVKEFRVNREGIIESYVEAEDWEEVRAIYIDSARCIRCGNCEWVCPTKCISVEKVSLKESFEDGS